MGMFEKIIVVIIIIILIAWIAPDQYEKGKAAVIDKGSDLLGSKIDKITGFNFTQHTDGRDYGMILGDLACQYDDNCVDYFGIEGLVCTEENTCWLGSK